MRLEQYFKISNAIDYLQSAIKFTTSIGELQYLKMIDEKRIIYRREHYTVFKL